jgi:phospholipase/lecithinase/hemolysin
MASPLFDQLYAVGDSLSDSGGIYQLSSELLSLAAADGINTEGLQPIPDSPPYAGKFSNGPVLPEITAELLGAQLINFSFGGAEALGTQTLEQAAGPAIPDQVKAEIAALPPDQRAQIEAVLNTNINLSGQMADLVAETSAHPPSARSALVSLIGLNDLQALIGTFNPSNPLALIGEAAQAAQVAAGIVQADLAVAHTAFSQGIGTVIFETLPAPSFFPLGSELPPELQAIGAVAINDINLGLKADALELRLEGHDARIVDLAQITGEISADPAAFGFQNLDQPTLLSNDIEFSGNPAAPPADQTAFFDPLHPTTMLHTLLAEFVAASLTSNAITVTAPNATVNGTANDDFIYSIGANGTITGGPGNDTIAAGAGINTAVYSGASKDYTVTITAGESVYSVQDKVGTDGTDTLANIQRLHFTDQTIDTTNFIATAALPHNQLVELVDLYIGYFDRAPDAIGFDYWGGALSHGMSFATIAATFATSPEGAAMYPATLSTADFVTSAYTNVLGRNADTGGFNFWVNELQSGAVTRGNFVLDFVEGVLLQTGTSDSQYLANKYAVGAYFALTQGLSDGNWTRAVMNGVDATAVSVANANHATDNYAAIAANPATSEFVVHLVGVAV